MELLWVRWILILLLFMAGSIHTIIRFSSHFKFSLAGIMLGLYVAVNVLYYFSPQLLEYAWYIHESAHPKGLQIQSYFSTIDFKVVKSESHNAFALWSWHNEYIVFTSKTLEESTLGELVGVSYHELRHIQERHTSSMILLAMLLYYILALYYKTVKWSRNRRIYIALFLSLVWLLAYLAFSRAIEHHADIYAKESWNWLGLAMYLERVVADSPNHIGVDRKWFETLRYLHPPLAERIKFLKDE